MLLAGPSGSGKSTLSYAMNGMIPWKIKGFSKGDVKIFGKSIWDYQFMELSKLVGLVKQNPLEQLVSFTVRDEIAFGIENLKYSKSLVEKKVDDISRFMGIHHLLDRKIDQLSGGQMQLTILSSFLVMEPQILILDEPIAFLDQNSESLLLNRLKKLCHSEEYNLTLIIIEHRLSRMIGLSDKIVVLDDNGKIKLRGTVPNILQNKFNVLKSCNVRVPWLINIFNEIDHKSPNPVNFNEALKLIESFDTEKLYSLRQVLVNSEIKPTHIKKFEKYEEIIQFDNLYIESLKNEISDMETNVQKNNKKIILETQDVTFKYPNTNIRAIKGLNIKIKSGDFIGLVGPNGSGKTTLLYLLAGLYSSNSGEILYKGQNISEIDQYEYAKKIGFIFQNPETMIFKRSIREEILYAPKNFEIMDEISEEYLSKLMALVGNESPEKNPFNLSWGQKRRLNLSSVFVFSPEIILLDEPFIGQDQRTIDELIETLYIENKRGKTIIISSHDYHLLLKYTKKIIELNKNGTLKDYDFNGNYFKRHKNLGPIILLDKINKRLESMEV